MFNKHIITVATIAGVAIGFLISLQVQAQKEVDIAAEIQKERLSQTNAVMLTLKDKNNLLQEEYKKLTSQLESARNEDLKNPYLIARLDELKIADGTIAVKGPGIKMIINDSVHDAHLPFPLTTDDLRRIINSMKFAGAEAISVNGQRIVGPTSIVMSGTSTILVNSVPISRTGESSYEILAIGDQGRLADYVTKLEVLPLRQVGMKAEIVKEIVTVPSYKGGYSMNYASKSGS